MFKFKGDVRRVRLLAQVFWVLLGFGLAATLTGCVSARMADTESDRLFRSRQYNEAAARLEKGLEAQGENGRDTLLFLLDLGLSLHSAGRYEESNKAFLRADKVADIKDYTSLAQEGATIITSDNAKDYKGEDFEIVLISTYLAMNYALLGNIEDALVEARRVNTKLYRMVNEGGRKYKQSAFARYLSAILYEAEGDFNNAYIDYKNTLSLGVDNPDLGLDLWRCAYLMRMPDEMDLWDRKFHLTERDHELAKLSASKAAKSEIIVLYENGISPRKHPNPSFSELPKFYPRLNPVSFAQVWVDEKNAGQTHLLEDIEKTAIANLDEKYGGMIARKMAGIVVKESVAYGVAKTTDSPLLGLLTRAALYAADTADLRSWNLLPRDLQILRVVVSPGTHHVKVTPRGFETLSEKVVQVLPGKKVFVNFRYMP